MKFQKKVAFSISLFFSTLFLSVTAALPASSPVDFFGARAFSNGGSFYYSIEDGDFDGDGKVDVLASNNTSIFVFYGDGSGRFSAPPVVVYTFSSAGSPVLPAAGDFNGDGKSDVAVTSRLMNANTPAIAVYFGNSNRTFSAPLYSNLNSAAYYLVPVDYNNDGKLDLLGGFDNSIVFYQGNAGAFTIGGQLTTSRAPQDITTGDFNNDNLPDVSFGDDYDLKVSQNLGNGSFGAPVTVDTIDYGFRSNEIADINNDGKNDLVAVQYTFFNPVVAVWLGNGNFTFTQAPDFLVESRENVFLQSIADLDQDQKMDLIFSSKNRTIISPGVGNGTFEPEESAVDGGGSFFVRDVDANGWLDIVAGQSVEFAVQGSGSFSVMLNLQNGFLKSAPAIPTGDGTKDIAVSDFNTDQLKDFVIVNRGGGGGPGEIIVLFQMAVPNSAEKSFFEPSGFSAQKKLVKAESSSDAGAGLDPYAVVAGDFNQDGRKDIIAVGHGAYGASQNTLILINQGNNTFIETLFQIGTGDIYDVATADFNGDGKLDLVTTGYLGTAVSFGTGTGAFSAPVPYFANVPSSQIVIGDFNNDSKPDIAVITYTVSKIGILLNDGTGTFTSPANPGVSGGLAGIAAADMNSDGILDLVASKGNGVAVLTGTGNGTFNAEVTYQIRLGSATGLAVTDLNGDGRPDAALLSGSNSVAVLLNDGAGGLSGETLWGGGVALSAIAADDLNNDAKIDLIIGFTTSSDGYTKILFNLTENQPAARRAPYDFDGDSKTDISVFRPSDGSWWYARSSAGDFRVYTFGASDDLITPGDYTGDGKTDLAVFRPSTGEWFVQRSEDNSFFSFPFGTNGDIPAPADYDGDGKTDAAVFRPSSATWFILNSTGSGTTIVNFGTSGDKPVPADFDGDGKADIAVFRPSDGSWWYLKSSNLESRVFRFGVGTDRPVAGDYTGDGKADLAVFRPSTGEWFFQRSEDNSYYSVPFGASGDIPSPGDYDGDGRFDTAVFRPSTGDWFVQRSTAGIMIMAFGAAGDRPVPAAFVP